MRSRPAQRPIGRIHRIGPIGRIRVCAGRALPPALLLALLAAGPRPAVAASIVLRAPFDDGMSIALADDGQMFLEATAQRGEGLLAFTRRLCGDIKQAPALAAANGGPLELEVGVRYRIPFDLLADSWRGKIVRRLFPGDRGQADGWHHQVRGLGSLSRESLWQLAVWFTGKGENFRAIREYNELADDFVAKGSTVTIPAELLLPSYRKELPAAETPFDLSYAKDAAGKEYAIYRLRPGEALYSSVVVRFTGRVFAQDVNATAAELARANGIADVTAIPVGYRIKIPLELLEPEFLPEGHPRRLEYEASLKATQAFSNQVASRDLAGITVILDAGHGGRDSGATKEGVWESLYVYDIMLRVKRLLEKITAADVHATTRDGERHVIVDRDVLPFSRGHKVMTSPPYPIEDPVIGVNLRWYLANSLYRRAVTTTGDPQKVVFLSIHADSLHPSVRGTMVYIPAADLGSDSFAKTGPVYACRKEVQESPRVSLPWDQRVESEGLSRELADKIVGALKAKDLPVHPFKPVRDRILRDNGLWIPAVLRYNVVPAKVLVEVLNLANDEDRRLIQTRAYRQAMAESIVNGLLSYYRDDRPTPLGTVQIAKATK